MEKWRRIWRQGLDPRLSRAGLEALQWALIHDDPRLLQGTTCYPPRFDAMRECAVKGTCALGFCGWQGDGLSRVDQVEHYFQRLCDGTDAALSEAGACRYFLNWFDDAPREEMRRELIIETTIALAARSLQAA